MSIFEVGGGPGFVADDAFGDAEQIYSDIPVIWLKTSAAQVGGGDLQGIEQQAGGFGVPLAADDHAHDLSERDLGGVGVLEHGQNKLGCDVMGGVAQVNSGHAPAIVEVAIFAVAQCRGTALRAVGFDALTARDTIFVIGQDECSTPPPVIYCNQQDRGKFFGKSWIKRSYS